MDGSVDGWMDGWVDRQVSKGMDGWPPVYSNSTFILHVTEKFFNSPRLRTKKKKKKKARQRHYQVKNTGIKGHLHRFSDTLNIFYKYLQDYNTKTYLFNVFFFSFNNKKYKSKI
jgi:hypothetical protein